MKIADETAASLQKAVISTENTVKAVDKITEATAEQSQAVSQVTQGVDQISSVVQTNSATAEESAAASEELSGQAVILKDWWGSLKPGSCLGHDRYKQEYRTSYRKPAGSSGWLSGYTCKTKEGELK